MLNALKNYLFFVTLLFAVKVNSQCPTPPGNQTSYGSSSWIGYVYANVNTSNPPTNAFTTTYRGYITQPFNFDMDLGSDAVWGPYVCGSYADQFSIRFRMRYNFPAGTYTFTVGGDDGYRLSLDGGSTYIINNWNEHSYTSTTVTVNVTSGNKNLVLEYFEQQGLSRVSFQVSGCPSTTTTAPTDISGVTTVCNGSSTTLTAVGGTNASGVTYQWGIGNTVGNNIISGETAASITVSPTTNTTYWVRKIDGLPCNTPTSGVTKAVTVNTSATPPTAITNGNATICLGNSITLTATGSTAGTSSVFEWGTGNTVGNNVISGETGASITVSPTSTTSYWVRRKNTSGCTNNTSGIITVVNVTNPAGDQISYGNDSWIGYVYASVNTSNPPTNAFTTSYKGYITQSEIFDQDLGGGALSGANLCGTYADQFSIRFKMRKNMTPGYYTFTVGGDDGYRLSVDGGVTFIIDRFYDQSYSTAVSSTIYLSGETNFVLEYYEQGGSSRISFNYTACTDFSTAPTAINGTTSLCSTAGGTNLTAVGGVHRSGATYQWGTGSIIGSNIMSGQTNASMYVNPSTTTTYWVRRVDGSPCNQTTDGVTVTITVSTRSTQPSISPSTVTICAGNPITLTASGGTHGTDAVYQWGTGYSAGVNIISGETGSTITVNPTVQTGYWVRRVDSAPCNYQTGHSTATVNVTSRSTAPTAISGVTTLCAGSSTTLTATGGTTGSNGTFQWGTGSVIGSNVISGQNASISVNPSTSTTYWVRRNDSGTCSQSTDGVFHTITVSVRSTQPSISASGTTICSGSEVILTASGGTRGTDAVYQWGTGGNGTNIISDETGSSITVYPTAQTRYWVRRIDSAPCNTQTGYSNVTVNVNTRSTSPTTISGVTDLCAGSSTTLTVSGGTHGSNATYQWGTGSVVGSNVISGQNASISVNPSTTTTYWVRRNDSGVCSQSTDGVFHTITVSVRSTQPSISASATTVCSGSEVVLTASGGTHGTDAVYQWGTGSSGTNIIPNESGSSITVYPTAQTRYWVRRLDPAPCNTQTNASAVTINMNSTAVPTAPTAINGTTSLCSTSGGTSLSAAGGSGSTYQWGTGNEIGSNIISGQTNQSMYINPSATTTYWVRRVNTGSCGATYTDGVTVTVNVSVRSEQPSITTTSTTTCSGSSVILTATGGIHGTNAVYQWGTGYSAGSNIIVGETGSTITVSPTVQTGYWVRRVDPAPCNYQTGHSTITITISPSSVTPPSSITNSNSTVCEGSSTILTANGGSGSIYQWGIGTEIGSNVIAGETTASITVTPSSTTTYWVRRYDSGCNTYTIARAITVNTIATVPGSLSTTKTVICKNTRPSEIILSGNEGNVVKWQSASDNVFTTGVTDIASTATTLTGNALGTISNTVYIRAVVQRPNCALAYTTPIEIVVPEAVIYNGTSWSATPNETTPVNINGNLTLSSDLNVCSCTVVNGSTLTVLADRTLTIQNNLTVEETSNLIVEDRGSLVQIDDNAVNTGKIIYKRKTTPMKRYDYTYWSSPLEDQKLSILGLPSLFYAFNPAINNWTGRAATTTMNIGLGYIARVPDNLDFTTPQIIEIPFNGTPNNGIITTPIIKATGGAYNLIGNPYPSAIDIDAFLLDPVNSGIVNGTIFLWTHNTAIRNTVPGNSAIFNYTADDYAKYNITGGVKTANSAITGGVEPTGKVAAGQGFFIEANSALANGNYVATFKNSMRVQGQNNQFYRTVMPQSNVANTTSAIEKNRVWLHLTNVQGAYDEILIGYVTAATNNFDNLYDGKIFPAGNVVSFYSVAGADKYAIQGRALPFDQNDVVPLGYTTSIASTFTIGIEKVDGFFEDNSQEIYLLDKQTNIYHNLKTAPFTFTSSIGTFTDRFEIHYRSTSLGNSDFEASDASIIKNENHITVKTTNGNLKSIDVFDILGKKLYSKNNINTTEFNTADFNIATQVLIVKVTLDNNQIITKKLIMN